MNSAQHIDNSAVQTHQDLQCFVKLGLLHFWRSALPDDNKLMPLLLMELKVYFKNDELPDWSSYKEIVSANISRQTDSLPIVKAIKYYNLSMPDVFLIALLGEVESNYLVNLIITELQAPDKSSRPALHLIENILECCFELNVSNNHFILSIEHHPLVKAGLILRENEDLPLPLQKLKTTATIWQALLNGEQAWPNCQLLSANQSLVCAQTKQAELEQLYAVLQPYYSAVASKALSALNGIVIRGAPGTGRHQFASALAQKLSLQALSVPVSTWQKTPLLHRLTSFCRWLPILRPNLGPGEVFKLEATVCPVIIILGAEGSVAGDDLIDIRLQLPNAQERRQCWLHTIDDLTLANQLGDNVLLSEKTIFTIANYAKRLATKNHSALTLHHIQQARRHQSAEKLRLLAEPVFRDVDINAMVLPPMVAEGLNHLVMRAHKRESLWRGLGKTLNATSNPGVRALFVGDSGTGKTLAASYVATQLSAPLYRVDLSSIMNKYIGESEKNLANLLDEAAANDVVLLFDEADSLFGSRSEGDNNGERFANMLTNFLLTRIENHPGVVILTSNSKERIDNAFNRRLDVIIDFPLPGSEDDLITQQDIWQGLMAEFHKLGRDIPGQLVYLNSVVEHCA